MTKKTAEEISEKPKKKKNPKPKVNTYGMPKKLRQVNLLKKAKFPESIKKARGFITVACRQAGIDINTYYAWRNADPEFKKLCEDAILAQQEENGDFVESKLMKQVDKDNITAIIFYCKTKLKERGYVERVETTGKNGEAIQTESKVETNLRTVEQNFQDIVTKIGLTSPD